MSLFDTDNLYYKYVIQNIAEFEKIYELCADSNSKDALIGFINTQIVGNGYLLQSVISEDQYFPKDIIQLKGDEIYIDCGAYNGDTIQQFICHADNRYQKIIAFEPDKKNMESLKKYISNNGIKNIECYPCGVWDCSGFVGFKSDGNRGSSLKIHESENTCAVITIDSVIMPQKLQKSAGKIFIKMDIEGSELRALIGASETIRKYHPILMICAYHKKEDIIDIPTKILELYPDYKIYFRHHSPLSMELVCYAIPSDM